MSSQHPLIWFQDGIGHEILLREIAAIDRHVSSYGCKRLLQLGGPSFWDVFPKFHYVHYDESLNFSIPGHNICGDFTQLGMLSDCVDTVVVPHLQEIMTDFPKVLPEIMRVLRYEGTVVVFGFNPLSLWGMQRILGFSNIVPWCSRFYSAGTLIKKFEDNDFVYIARQDLYPGIHSKFSLVHKASNFLENFNILSMGAVYCLVFKKQASTMTLNTEKSKYYSIPTGA